MVARRNNFKEGLDVIRIKIHHFKGENKWESSGKLDSNGLDMEGLKAAQGNELYSSRTEYGIFLKEKAYPNVGS